MIMSDSKKVVLSKEELALLAGRYLDNKATEEEIMLLHTWYKQADEQELVLVATMQSMPVDKLEEAMLDDLKRRISAGKKKKTFRMHWWQAAAVLLLLLGAGITYKWMNTGSAPLAEVEKPAPGEDIGPGKNGAILTIPGNKDIVLDEMGNGKVNTESPVSIVKEGDVITYVFSPSSADDKVEYHTVSTPRGRQFKIKLPDGTEVMLDAASSVNFPTAFTGKERRVKVTGQVYFHVTRDITKPFIVDNGDMEVEVLGTEFNICSYTEEQKKTVTLLQGSVKVSNRENKKTNVLLPGQQAAMDKANQMEVLTGVDLQEVMAWKDGAFQFNDTKLSGVMNALSRWYDVDIVFKNANADRLFSGRISRSLHLNQVLDILRFSDVNVELDDKKLILMP